MKRATIYSIARACGVSAATVSRAFNRPEVVTPELRRRIMDAAHRLGYRTNKAARGLATGRTGAIGLLVPDLTNPFFPPLVRAVQRAATRRDTAVLLADTEESPAAEPSLVEHLRAQVDGLIVAAPRLPTVKTALDGTPAVVLNRRIRGLPAVICDNTAALRAAGDLLVERGHRRVAVARGPSASWAARQRAVAIHRWAGDAGVQVTDLGRFPASFDGGLEAAAELTRTDCTAAFAFDDLMACGVLAGLTRAGERVPDDRALVGCDDVLLARTVVPHLTTVAAPIERLGEAAVDLLYQRIDNHPIEEIRLEGRLVVRDST